jgi:hypothetical protein
MKVFISHSTRDRWIARKLSEEIVALGCDTFLDEKDIETGESIDDSIHAHLEDSDDFLLLLSPDSVKSQWVLIELGGALALKKRIVIALLYLGANDIPQPISRYLARDINDIERYYDEVRKVLSGKKPKVTRKKRVRRATGKPSKPFARGDVVRIISTPQHKTTHLVGWDPDGNMDKFCGTLAKIVSVDEDVKAAKIDEDGGKWVWALEWLTYEG